MSSHIFHSTVFVAGITKTDNGEHFRYFYPHNAGKHLALCGA